MRITFSVPTIVTALTLAACGGEDPAATGSELNGTWVTGCFNAGFTYARTTLEYDELMLVGTYTEYEDAECASATHVSRWTGVGTIFDTTPSGATELDLAFDSLRSTALTAANAEFNNMNMYCGFTDWEMGVEKDVLGAECYGFSIPVGGESLDIYTVEGDTLLFGENSRIGTGLSESDRPTTIDMTRVFTRR